MLRQSGLVNWGQVRQPVAGYGARFQAHVNYIVADDGRTADWRRITADKRLLLAAQSKNIQRAFQQPEQVILNNQQAKTTLERRLYTHWRYDGRIGQRLGQVNDSLSRNKRPGGLPAKRVNLPAPDGKVVHHGYLRPFFAPQRSGVARVTDVKSGKFVIATHQQRVTVSAQARNHVNGQRYG